MATIINNKHIKFKHTTINNTVTLFITKEMFGYVIKLTNIHIYIITFKVLIVF